MEQEIVVENTALALPDEGQFKRDIQAINRFQQIVHSQMIEGRDYGVIPGTQKPTLLKPGAEKIAKLLGLCDLYDIVDSKEDWERGFFRYIVKCKLARVSDGTVVSEGLGECNSMEDKYRWRESKRKCPSCGAEAIIKGKAEYGGGWICFTKKGGCGAKYDEGDSTIEEQKVGRVENDDVYSLVNTILKMSKKRALVDAALSAGRLSDLFTQDLEDVAVAELRQNPVTRPLEGKVDNRAQLEASLEKQLLNAGYKDKLAMSKWLYLNFPGVQKRADLNEVQLAEAVTKATVEATAYQEAQKRNATPK